MDRAERVLLFGALGMLLVSAGLGEGSAVGALDASGPPLRAHVHSGSLGWITLAVLAVALRMAADRAGGDDVVGGRARADRLDLRDRRRWRDWRDWRDWIDRLSWLAVGVTMAFVVADAVGSAAERAWAGAAALAMIAAFTGLLGWLMVARGPGESRVEARAKGQAAARAEGRTPVWPQGRAAARAEGLAAWSVPELGMGAALVVLLAGSALGALAAGAAAGSGAAPASLLSAHSATLSVPFVVLAATSVLEWAIGEQEGTMREAAEAPTTAGLVQVGSLVLAAVALIAGVLTRDLALVEANVPLELCGIVIFAIRTGPALLIGSAETVIAGRAWLVTGAVALAVDVGLVAHLVFEIGQRRYVTAAMIPRWLPFAVDHVTFVAVGTTCLFGAIAVMAGPRERARRSWADTLAAAGLATGLAGTTAGIGASSAVVTGTSGAVLGLALLGAVVVAVMRVRSISADVPR